MEKQNKGKQESIAGKYKLENFILKTIENKQRELKQLEIEKNDYIKSDYDILFNRFSGSINDLYIVLTGYDSKYEEFIPSATQKKGR